LQLTNAVKKLTHIRKFYEATVQYSIKVRLFDIQITIFSYYVAVAALR